MAIKRCPYCRSIIDEVDRYCNNCGTQLLFPEDESVEEDIPGERILEVEDKAPEEEVDIVPPLEEPPPPAKPLRDSGMFSRGSLKTEGDLIFPDLKSPKTKKQPEFEAGPESPRPFATRDLPEMDLETPSPAQPSKTGRFEIKTEKPKPSGDFESGFPTSAEEVDDIARLMSTLEKQSPPKMPPPTSAPPPDKAPFAEKDLPPLRFEEEKPQTSDELPPWAERVKDGVTPGFRAPTGEDMSRELGDLSFDSEPEAEPMFGIVEEGPGTEEDDLRRLAEPELRPRPRRRKRGQLSRLKARVYDILFVTLLWATSLWASSKVLGVSLFSIVQNTSLQVGIFYLVLMAGYFALFFFFLGETLGDRLSSSAS